MHLEVNSDPQYIGALNVPMRLPKLPSHSQPQPTHDNVHPSEQENHRALPRHNNASQKLTTNKAFTW